MVERYLSNPEPGFKVRIPITEDSDIQTLLSNPESALYERVREYLYETVMEYAKIEIGREPQGVFRYPEVICNDLYSRCDQLVKRKIDGRLCVQIWENGCLKSSVPVVLPEEIYDFGRDSEGSAVETGATILLQLEEFLKQGVWQVGFRSEDHLITDISSFPHLIRGKNGGEEWINNSGTVCTPLIWFGLPDEDPEEIWSLYPKKESDWHSFWFNHFWHLDWNALFGGFDNY